MRALRRWRGLWVGGECARCFGDGIRGIVLVLTCGSMRSVGKVRED